MVGYCRRSACVFSATETEQLFANVLRERERVSVFAADRRVQHEPAGFDNLKDNTDPEKARTYEAGIRTRRAGFEASLAGYFIDYRNRLIGVAVCPLTATCVSSFANVGNVTSKGVEGLVVRAPGGRTDVAVERSR